MRKVVHLTTTNLERVSSPLTGLRHASFLTLLCSSLVVQVARSRTERVIVTVKVSDTTSVIPAILVLRAEVHQSCGVTRRLRRVSAGEQAPSGANGPVHSAPDGVLPRLPALGVPPCSLVTVLDFAPKLCVEG